MARKKRICGRSLNLGPGSCYSWWDGCPKSVEHCFQRWVSANGGRATREEAEEWHAEREKALPLELDLKAEG